jgi:hypothetical protein
MHQRRIIRDAIAAQLIGKTAAGPRVTRARVDPHQRRHLPALSVYTPSESVDPDSTTRRPRELTRELAVEIVGWAVHSEAYPATDALDDLAEQVEAVIDLDPYLGGAAGLGGAVLQSTDVKIEGEENSDLLVGVIVLTYTVPYTTSPPPAAELAEFLRAGVTTVVDGATVDNSPTDVIQVRP